MGKKNNQAAEERQARRTEKKEQRSLNQQARRNARLQYQPALNNLDRMREQGLIDVQNNYLGAQSVHAGAGEELAGLPKQYNQMTKGNVDDFQAQMAALAQNINPQALGNIPSGEMAAGQQLFGTSAANTLGNMYSTKQRNQGYNQSSIRENELSNRYTGLNIQQGWADKLQQLDNEEARIRDMIGVATRSEAEDLRKEAAYQQLVRDLIGNKTGPNTITINTGGEGKDDKGTQNPPRTDTSSWETVPHQTDTGIPNPYQNDPLQGPPSATPFQNRIRQTESWQDLPPWLQKIVQSSWNLYNPPGTGPDQWHATLETPYRETPQWFDIRSNKNRRRKFNEAEQMLFHVIKQNPAFLAGLVGTPQ